MSSVPTRRSILTLTGGVLLATRSAWAGNSKPGEPIMTSARQSACTAYLDAWSRKDLDGIAALLHPQVHFKGPMQELDGRAAVVEATRRIFPLLERFDVHARFISGDRAMFAYDFVCREPIGVCRTAELVRFENGLIRETELFFDARPFEAMQRAQAARGTPTDAGASNGTNK